MVSVISADVTQASCASDVVPDRIRTLLDLKVLDRKSVILRKLPLHDGEESFARALVTAQGGVTIDETVTRPVGILVESHLGFIGEDNKSHLGHGCSCRTQPRSERLARSE